MVKEICHFAYIDRESPKYLSSVDERFCNISVIPCHTYHSHVWVFCLLHLHFSEYAWKLCVNWMTKTNSNNCLEACGKNQWDEIGATVRNGIREYLVRCSWCSDSPSSSVSLRHSSLARAAFCCSCSKSFLLSLSSNVNFSTSLGREKREKASI